MYSMFHILLEPRKFSDKLSESCKEHIISECKSLDPQLPNLPRFSKICVNSIKQSPIDKSKKLHQQIANPQKNRKKLENLAKDLDITLRFRNFIPPPPSPSTFLLIQRCASTSEILETIDKQTHENFEKTFQIPTTVPGEQKSKSRKKRGIVDCSLVFFCILYLFVTLVFFSNIK